MNFPFIALNARSEEGELAGALGFPPPSIPAGSRSDPAFRGSLQMASAHSLTLRWLSFLSPSLLFLSLFILVGSFSGLIPSFCFTSFR